MTVASVWLDAIPWIGALLGTLLCLHMLATWMESRGWIVYLKPAKKGYGAALSNAMAEFDALLNPAAEHRMAEERYQEEARWYIATTSRRRSSGRDYSSRSRVR